MAIPKEVPQVTPEAEISANPTVESSPNPERLRMILTKTVVIPGASNTGKDEITRILNERHGWPVFDGTSSGFKRRGSDHEKGHIKRTRKEHRRFDYEQGLSFDNLTESSEHQLHQTRLGGIILAERKDRRSKQIGEAIRKNEWHAQSGRPLIKVPPEIPAISILLWARKEVRVQRAYNQKLNAYEDQQLRIASGEVISEDELIKAKPTLESVEAEMESRQKKDVLDWAPGHRDYIQEGENPFSRTLKRKNTGPLYDFWIDTSDITPDQVADRIEEILLKNSAAKPLTFAEFDAIAKKNEGKDRPEKPTYPSTVIFDSSEMSEKRVKEPKTNGHDKDKEEIVSSGLEHGEPINRTPHPDRHPNHPSRRKLSQGKIIA